MKKLVLHSGFLRELIATDDLQDLNEPSVQTGMLSDLAVKVEQTNVVMHGVSTVADISEALNNPDNPDKGVKASEGILGLFSNFAGVGSSYVGRLYDAFTQLPAKVFMGAFDRLNSVLQTVQIQEKAPFLLL